MGDNQPGPPEPSSRERDVRDEFTEVLIKNEQDLIFVKGPVLGFEQFKFGKFACPLTECSKPCDSVESLQSHIVNDCQYVLRSRTQGRRYVDQIKKLIAEAKDTQEANSYISKKVESSELILKCPLNSPLVKYLRWDKLKIYDKAQLGRTGDFRQMLNISFERRKQNLFFDFSLVIEMTADVRTLIKRKILQKNSEVLIVKIPSLKIKNNNDDESDDEEGNPYSDEVFNGIRSKKVKWDQDKTPAEYKTIIESTTVAVITDAEKVNLPLGHILKAVKNFECRVPERCKEALSASEHGHSKPYTFVVPGIPKKKFSESDQDRYGTLTNDDGTVKDWTVQALFENKTDKNLCTILFEGWTVCESAEISDKAEERLVAPILKTSRIRASFLAEIEKWGPQNLKATATKQRYIDTRNFPSGQLFWILQDMTYFHSKQQEEYRLAPVIYISLDENAQPPKFSFTPINVMSQYIYYNWVCNKNSGNTSIVLEDFPKRNIKKDARGTSCEKGDGCFCLTHFHHLAISGGRNKLAPYLKIFPDGRIDVSELVEGKERVVYECTNFCKCSHMCPRRTIQRGQQKPLIVYYESAEEGYGLRAGASFKKGEFIGEVTGQLKEARGRNFSPHQVAFEFLNKKYVLDFEKVGNCFRFLHSSQSPNASLVEAYARKMEGDPNLPRMAVYATKEIAFGDKITVPVSRRYEQ